jgi:hypothetical protein
MQYVEYKFALLFRSIIRKQKSGLVQLPHISLQYMMPMSDFFSIPCIQI